MALKDETINEFLNTTTPIKTFIKNPISTENYINNSTTEKIYNRYKVFDNPPETEKAENPVNTTITKNCDSNNVKFVHMTGLTKNIVLLLHEKCRMSHDRITPQLSIKDIVLSCGTTKLSVQKTIQRLEKKHVITRVEFKSGRNGWTRYSLSESIYREVLSKIVADKVKSTT